MTEQHKPAPHEIVPEALRKQLRWDWRHDAMAALIIEKFKLQLPRDRELIRQLAFVHVQQGSEKKERVQQNETDHLPAGGARAAGR
jgi:hypothetical protein